MSDSTQSADLPVGVFDSGVGGLTVVRAIRDALPGEDIVYIGDTARVPYGGKSAATVERYGLEIGKMLEDDGVKAIVVACNTASALALPRMREDLGVPVLGVVEPGAEAAIAATKNGHIGVIGTRATVKSGAYEKAIRARCGDVRISAAACPLLVPLIEELWLRDPVTRSVIARYLEPLISKGIDTLVLGCTHYPLLKAAIANYCGEEITIVDSASACALALGSLLEEHGVRGAKSVGGELHVEMTDAADGFLEVANNALGLGISGVKIRRIDS